MPARWPASELIMVSINFRAFSAAGSTAVTLPVDRSECRTTLVTPGLACLLQVPSSACLALSAATPLSTSSFQTFGSAPFSWPWTGLIVQALTRAMIAHVVHRDWQEMNCRLRVADVRTTENSYSRLRRHGWLLRLIKVALFHGKPAL